MKLKEINKKQYRKRLNVVIVGFVVVFAMLALTFGSAFIAMFSTSNALVAAGETPPSNFKFNLAGVACALFVCMAILHRLRNTEFFTEIYYVWQLKQVQNIILRKLTKIKDRVYGSEVDAQACTILMFYFASLKQLYQLDDNTITMSALNRDAEKLAQHIEQHSLTISLEAFDKTLLAAYK